MGYEYRVVRESSAEILEISVREAMQKGWVPQGGVSVMYNAGGYVWAQAMMRYTLETSKTAAQPQN